MMEQILQGSLLIAALGLIFIVLFQIVKAATGLVLIGLIGSLAFMEILGFTSSSQNEISIQKI